MVSKEGTGVQVATVGRQGVGGRSRWSPDEETKRGWRGARRSRLERSRGEGVEVEESRGWERRMGCGVAGSFQKEEAEGRVLR